MTKSGKVWGHDLLVFSHPTFEIHRIDIKKGGICSQHRHQYKFNGFFVESGKLLVRVWKNDYDLIDETILEDQQFTKVKPNEYHQFEALEDTIAFEVYWTEFDPEDIERKNIGHLKQD